MKIGNLVSISGSGKGIKIAAVIILIPLLLSISTLFAAHKNFSIPSSSFPVAQDNPDGEKSQNLQNYRIDRIYFEYEQGQKKKVRIKNSDEYELLLAFKPGDTFNYKKIRENIATLYKTGLFSDVKVEIEKLENNRLNLYYVMGPQYIVGAVKIETDGTVGKKHIFNAILSLRRGITFEEDNVENARQEIRSFLNSRGYFDPEITYEIILPDDEKTQRSHVSVDVLFNVKPGRAATVEKLVLTVANNEIREQLKHYFTARRYIPNEFQKAIENARKKLKEQLYYFPEIKIKENFLDAAKTKVNLEVVIKPGYRYEFRFRGMKRKIDLIATIWEKKVFEKWAENESKARILYYLKNKGYLNAEVGSAIVIKNLVKSVTFKVKKNMRYALGQIRFTGNQSFSEKKLTEIVKTDDQFFDRHFYLRFRSLRVDQEVLRLFYYFNGFPTAAVSIEPFFRGDKVDIMFVITEGKKFTVDTILFNGNRTFTPGTLYPIMQTHVNGPFVQQKLNEDLERLRDFYNSRGFDDVKLTADISPGNAKSILVNIEEGQSYRVGNLIIIGASDTQEKLIRNLFPLKSKDYYDRSRIELFKSDIENSAIFNELKVVKIGRTADVVDVLIKVTPDTNKYYGFGVGGEWAVGAPARLRGTLEYQQRNIFDTYSTLSGVFQIGEVDKKITIRGAVSFDTPYLFKRQVNSELKAWADSEQFPSYNFTRLGASKSIVQKLSQSSYFLSSFLFYRTRLNELDITPTAVDQVGTSFYTAAFRLSYVREKRDDPFNPTSGDFFSSDFKMGLLMLADKSQHPFFKFQWSYQKIFKFLKTGTLVFSIRNGLADGELSITERFFAGGVNTFRGTKTDRLGPMDALHNSPKGGNAMLLLNLEATFPIPFIPSNDFYYSVFADVGNLFEKVSQFRLNQMEKALGFGLKLKTQLGPLRLDFAWNLAKKETDNFRVHIGIGNVF
ncbi:MAG TPA: POTRA domain-containing protein [Candidatus Kapabacteria bacterium]|nr:POTRA domain-containing protein [Candidatus Kapabacteria bacterium]